MTQTQVDPQGIVHYQGSIYRRCAAWAFVVQLNSTPSVLGPLLPKKQAPMYLLSWHLSKNLCSCQKSIRRLQLQWAFWVFFKQSFRCIYILYSDLLFNWLWASSFLYLVLIAHQTAVWTLKSAMIFFLTKVWTFIFRWCSLDNRRNIYMDDLPTNWSNHWKTS